MEMFKRMFVNTFVALLEGIPGSKRLNALNEH